MFLTRPVFKTGLNSICKRHGGLCCCTSDHAAPAESPLATAASQALANHNPVPCRALGMPESGPDPLLPLEPWWIHAIRLISRPRRCDTNDGSHCAVNYLLTPQCRLCTNKSIRYGSTSSESPRVDSIISRLVDMLKLSNGS